MLQAPAGLVEARRSDIPQRYARRVDNALPTTEVVSRLAALRREHRDLDVEIEQRVAGIQADELTVKRLKKRKLWLKDCIARLESALIPDEPA
jgi:hypothetical protein